MISRLFHDSRDVRFRSPSGAQKTHAAVTLRLIAEGDQIEEVTLRLWWENAEKRLTMRPDGEGRYACRLLLPARPGLLWYFDQSDGSLLGRPPRFFQICQSGGNAVDFIVVMC